MKNFSKLNIAFVALTVMLFAFIGFQWHSSRELHKNISQNQEAGMDSIHHTLLKDGSRAAERTSFILTKSEYEKTVLVKRDSIKRLKERIGSLNHLTNDLKLKLSIKGNIATLYRDTSTVSKEDTLRSKSFTYEDAWINLNGNIKHDSVGIKYRICADLDIATYWKRQGLFKPDLLSVNITSSNPNLEISRLDNYQIREPKSFFESRVFALAAGFAAGLLIPK
jgi:hypothetical protein